MDAHREPRTAAAAPACAAASTPTDLPAPRDLATPEGELAARRSLRAARARRAVALRARRLTRGRRSAVAAAVALAAFGGAGAAAHQTGGSVQRVVERGDRGGIVVQLQRKLGVTADGVYGPRTRAAVRRFQRRNGLLVDGVAGPQTLGALGLASARSAPRAQRTAGGPERSASATLERIARCESGGDPTAVSADGRYRGKYQFTRATWRAMGGKGDPAAAPEAEQDRRAAKLLAARGTAPWPACAAG